MKADQLHALARLVARAEQSNPHFAYTANTRIVESPAIDGVPMYIIAGTDKSGEVSYTAGPYTAERTAARLQQMMTFTVGD